MRNKAAHFCRSSFYQYTKLLNLKRINATGRRKNHHTGIRANALLQLLHADVTVYRTLDNVKAFIYLVQDNFSRTILSHAVSLECKAVITKKVLKQVHEKYLFPAGIETCQLMTDDGSENFGEVQAFIGKSIHPSIDHIIAQRDVVYSNSMIEAANKNIKYHFLYHKEIPDFNSLCVYVAKGVKDYNNRPHDVLNGLTPLEVLNGKQLDKNDKHKEMAKAKATRIQANKSEMCCFWSF